MFMCIINLLLCIDDYDAIEFPLRFKSKHCHILIELVAHRLHIKIQSTAYISFPTKAPMRKIGPGTQNLAQVSQHARWIRQVPPYIVVHRGSEL